MVALPFIRQPCKVGGADFRVNDSCAMYVIGSIYIGPILRKSVNVAQVDMMYKLVL